jgi:hypothetical protein
MVFARLDRRELVADFGGGAITSDAGALLLGATDKAINLVDRFAACFTDGRMAERVVHDLRTLVAQRVFGIALGYEVSVTRPPRGGPPPYMRSLSARSRAGGADERSCAR